jgi:hypothetical protein
MMRSSMIDVLRAGLHPHRPRQGPDPRPQIILRHALPNAILPIIAMIGIDIGIFMGGIVVVESVFGWPGIGQLAWQAIQRVDIPIIMGVTLVSACAIVLGNLLADSSRLSSTPASNSADPTGETTMKNCSLPPPSCWRWPARLAQDYVPDPNAKPGGDHPSPTRTTWRPSTRPSATTGRTGR